MGENKLKRKKNQKNDSNMKEKKSDIPVITKINHLEKCCSYCLCYCSKRINYDPKHNFDIVGHIKVSNEVNGILYNN